MYLRFEKAMCRPLPISFQIHYTCFFKSLRMNESSHHLLDIMYLLDADYVTAHLKARRINLFSGLYHFIIMFSEQPDLKVHQPGLRRFADVFRLMYEQRWIQTFRYNTTFLHMMKTYFKFVESKQEILVLNELLDEVKDWACKFTPYQWLHPSSIKLQKMVDYLSDLLYYTYLPYLARFMALSYPLSSSTSSSSSSSSTTWSMPSSSLKKIFQRKYIYYIYALMDLKKNSSALMESLCLKTHSPEYNMPL
ncbi:hypothetical protein HMI54_001861 [Coelomomyces lativittatus]|nr:hypothetical protein HMI54_001861 [Coelomomyces lativittatus]